MQGRLQGLYAVVREDVLEHVGALDFFLLLDQYKDMHKEWYFGYYYRQEGIPRCLYNKQDMQMPVYRGEVATLIAKYVTPKEEEVGIGEMLSQVKYFNDIPSKIVPREECSGYGERAAKVMQITQASMPYYYPKYYWVVEGKEDMVESQVMVLNYCNYKGIMCGYSDGSSGWNRELTRGEAIAILARAFRPAQRLPVEKRLPDKSPLKISAKEDIYVWKRLNPDIKSGTSSSGSATVNYTMEYFNPTWDEVYKERWFESQLGFVSEFDDVYTLKLSNHMDRLGIEGDTFLVRHQNWHEFLKNELNITFEPNGLIAYREYCSQNNISVK